MKSILIAFVLVISTGFVQAQDLKRPIVIRNLTTNQALTPLDAKLNELEKRIQQSEEKLNALQTENASLKEQLNNQRTSIKAIDMVLTDVKETYANHVHHIGDIRISGFISTKLDGVAYPVKVLTTQSNSSPQYSGKAEAAK